MPHTSWHIAVLSSTFAISSEPEGEYLTGELRSLVVHPWLALLSGIWNDFPFSIPKFGEKTASLYWFWEVCELGALEMEAHHDGGGL